MSSHLSLLILPGLPTPATTELIEAAHGKSIASVLSKLRSKIKSEASNAIYRLDTVVATPASTVHFDYWQSVVALIYQVICAKAAEQSLELDTEKGLDIRIFIADTTASARDTPSEDTPAAQVRLGPIVDLPTLALSGRDYSPIYSVESEEGEKTLKRLLHHLPSVETSQIERVPGGIVLHHSRSDATGSLQRAPQASNHKSVAVGGTFDHLHIGHKLLLFGTALALTPESSSPYKITIGITGDALLTNKKFASVMESWETRQERVADFIESLLIFSPSQSKPRIERGDKPEPNGRFVRHIFHQLNLTFDYVQISDPFGPTITDPDITALVISAETRAGGAAVNKKREEKGWNPLEVFEISVLDAGQTQMASSQNMSQEDFQSKISSTEMRKRIVEREKDKAG